MKQKWIVCFTLLLLVNSLFNHKLFAGNGAWTSTVLDNVGTVGQSSSLAIDGSNTVHISYFDFTNQALKYGSMTVNGTWTSTTLESTGGVDLVSSLAIDSSNTVHISYYYPASGDLKYGSITVNGTWTSTTLDSAGDIGRDTSLAIGGSNTVHICYYDYTNSSLKYGSITVNGTWTSTTLDSGGGSREPSLAIDGSNTVHISYYGNPNLEYGSITVASVTTTEGGGGYEPPKETLTVSSTEPSNGETGVPVDTTISAKFSMLINGSTVTTDSFYISGSDGNKIEGEASTDYYTAVFTPSENLSYDTTYTAVAATKIQAANWAGTQMDSEYSWSFTTASPADTGTPTGSLFINNDAVYATSIAVTLNLSAEDDIGVTGYYISSGSSTPSAASSGWTPVPSTTSYRDNISYELESGDGKKVLYAFYKDDIGNVSDAVGDSIILDTAPPEIVSTEPANNATDVAIDAPFTVTFSEEMDVATIGTATIVFSNIEFGTAAYSGTNTTVTLTLLENLEYGTTYYGAITTGASDAAGNPLAEDFPWSFTTLPYNAIATPSASPTPAAASTPTPATSISPAATPSPTPVKTGAIAGKVTNGEDGTAIEGALVTANPGGYSDISDTNGNYRISGIFGGEYTVTASAGGFIPSSQTTTVIENDAVILDFALQPLPTPTPAPSATATPALTPAPSPSITPTPTIIPLKADFTAVPVIGEKPLNVQFTDASTGEITSWKWDFGDGNTSVSQHPTHEYAKKG